MYKLLIRRVFIVFAAALFLGSCGYMMKTVGGLAGSLLTQKTADLSTASVNVSFIRNMYPKAVNTVEVEYLKDDWREGGNMVTINFFKREGIGMYSIDGKVFIDGIEVPHFANGFYGKWVDKNDFSPKTIRVETSTGQVAEFVVTPAPPIKIISVNGKKENPVVDIQSDLSLELESPGTDKNTEFSVSLLADIMKLRTFTDYGIFKYKNKISLPAAMWRNPGTSIAPIEGENWLKVERANLNLKIIKGVGATQIVGTSIDCVPVTVTGKIEQTWVGTIANEGLRLSETFKDKNGTMKVEMSKPNAFLGRPMSSAKKFAVVSFTVRATKLQQSRTKTRTHTTYGPYLKTTTTTTTTTTRTFPELPDAYWESLVNSLYADFEHILKNNYDISLIPVEQVKRAPSYKDLEPIKDNVSVVEVEKSYKGTKNLIPTTLSAIIDNIATTFASDRIDSRLIRELGVDGIIAVTIDLEMPWEGFSLSPRLSLRISGPPNGYKAGPTIYEQGVISGNGMKLNEAKMDAKYVMDILPNVIRQKELMNALETGLKKMAEKEKKADYDLIWSYK